MVNVQAELNSLKIVAIVLGVLTALITVLRLVDRSRKNRLWWDDLCAFIAMLFVVVDIAIVEVSWGGENGISSATKIGLYYVTAQFYYATNWTARLSMLLTIIRLCVPGRLRTWLTRSLFIFGCAWVVLFAQVFWVCEREPGWKQAPSPQCDLGRNVAIAQVITDVTTDIILIAAPINLVRKVNLSRAQKIRIIGIFCATSIATVVSLYHAYAIFKYGGFEEARAAVIQVDITLVVANLSVIVALIMRITTEDAPPPSMELRSAIQFKRSRKTFNTLTVDIDTTVTRDGDHHSRLPEVIVFPDAEAQQDSFTSSKQLGEHESLTFAKD